MLKAWWQTDKIEDTVDVLSNLAIIRTLGYKKISRDLLLWTRAYETSIFTNYKRFQKGDLFHLVGGMVPILKYSYYTWAEIMPKLRHVLELEQPVAEVWGQKCHYIRKQIKHNISILAKTLGSRKRLDVQRKKFAIYRLYKYFSLSPPELSRLCKTSDASIQRWIGEAFKHQCLSDTQCVFKPFFTHEKTLKNLKKR